MSEFTKLSNRLDHIHEAVNALISTYPSSPPHDSNNDINNETLSHDYQKTLGHIEELTNTLLPGFDRFVAKCDVKDPVTGEERYGKSPLHLYQPSLPDLFSSCHFISCHVGIAMKKKILDRHEQSRAVLASATALGSSLQPVAEQIQLERQQEEAKRQRMEIDSVNAQRAADEQTASSASTSLQEEALRQHEEQVKVQQQLRLKAETSRCRRKYLTGILRQLTTTLNDHRPRGEAAIVKAVKRLQVACSHSASSNSTEPQTSSSSSSLSPYHTALQTVVTLLGTPLHLLSCRPTPP